MGAENDIGMTTIEALTERAFYFLSRSEFAKAELYFNRILDINPKSHEAYWGLLLTDHQCSDTAELYNKFGIPVDNDDYYKSSCLNADKEQRDFYKAVSFLTAFSCHLRFMENAILGDVFLMNKWKNHYFKSSLKNEKLMSIHERISVNSGAKSFYLLLPGILLDLLNEYKQIDFLYDVAELSETWSEMLSNAEKRITELYAKIMRDGIDSFKTDSNCASVDKIMIDISAWVNPLKVYSEETGIVVNADIGIDGYSSDIAQRYIFVAETLITNHDINSYEIIEQCYDAAADTECVSDRVNESREKFYAAITENENVTLDELLFVLAKRPNDSLANYKYFVATSKNFERTVSSYLQNEEFDSFITKKSDSYSFQQGSQVLDSLNLDLTNLETEYNQILAETKLYAEKAIEATNDSLKSKYQNEWNAYSSSIYQDYIRNKTVIEERIKDAKIKIHSDDSSGKLKATMKGIGVTFASFITLALMLPAILFGVYASFNQYSLLEHNVILFYIIALGIAVVVFSIQMLISKKLRHIPDGKYKIPKLWNIAVAGSTVLTVLVFVASVALLGYSFVTFSDSLGKVEIKTSEQMKYVVNYPLGDYVLSDDIDMNGETLENIFWFAGEFNGNGKTISNFVCLDNDLVSYNSGKITNVNFSDFNFDGGLCSNNEGIIEKIMVNGKECTDISKLVVLEIKYVNAGSGLRLRTGPSTSDEVITTMPYGASLEVHSVENGWAYVTYDKIQGWCSSDYLQDTAVL